MHEQLQKKRKEGKGFDLLEAIYAEQGLISGSHVIGAKAIGDTKAHAERKVETDRARHRASFVEGVRGREAQAHGKRASFLHSPEEERGGKLPLQMKKPDIDDPRKGKGKRK